MFLSLPNYHDLFHTENNLLLDSTPILTHPTPLCCIYTSVNWVILGSGNGLSSVGRQAISRINAGLCTIGILGTNFNEN